MADIIDLDFYRKFRIILPIRRDITRLHVLQKDKSYGSGQYTKRFRRKRKIETDPKIKKKDQGFFLQMLFKKSTFPGHSCAKAGIHNKII